VAISKRLRFEILRRDNHACRYCGAAAPEVKLTVDHVIPEALGGTTTPDNLTAACVDCNAGKSSVPPDAPLVDDVRADAARWSSAMRQAADVMQEQREPANNYALEFYTAWTRWTFADGEFVPLEADWPPTLRKFHDLGLPFSAVQEAVDITMATKHIPIDKLWRYFCAVCRNALHRQQELAQHILNGQEAASHGA